MVCLGSHMEFSTAEHSAIWGAADEAAEVSRAWIFNSLVDSMAGTTFSSLGDGGKKWKPFECIKSRIYFTLKINPVFLFLKDLELSVYFHVLV